MHAKNACWVKLSLVLRERETHLRTEIPCEQGKKRLKKKQGYRRTQNPLFVSEEPASFYNVRRRLMIDYE